MKAEPQKPNPAFSPITITLETPEEVAAVFAVFNHATIAGAVGHDDNDDYWSRAIRGANREAGNADIVYADLHSKLQALLK